ncbi:MAG: hypothetical protein HN337_01485 [Deltaproteobacteria bacterium]|nr:hypothetical protein [Deltaproteobacteria bacterium]
MARMLQPAALGMPGIIQRPVSAACDVARKVMGVSLHLPFHLSGVSRFLPTTSLHPNLSSSSTSEDAATMLPHAFKEEVAEALIGLVDDELLPKVEARAFEAMRVFIEALRPEIMVAVSTHDLIVGGMEALRVHPRSTLKRTAWMGVDSALAFGRSIGRRVSSNGRIDKVGKENTPYDVLEYIARDLNWSPRLKHALAVHYLSTGADEVMTEHLVPALKSLEKLPHRMRVYKIIQVIMRYYKYQLEQLPDVVALADSYADPENKIVFLENLYSKGKRPFADYVLRTLKLLEKAGVGDADRKKLLWQVVVDMKYTTDIFPSVKSLSRGIILLGVERVLEFFQGMDIEANVQYEILESFLDPENFEFETLKAFDLAVGHMKRNGELSDPTTRVERIRAKAAQINEEREDRILARLSKSLDREFSLYPELDEFTPGLVEKYGDRYSEIKAKMDELGITVLDRFGKAEVAQEIILNRTNPDPNDTRPVAVVLMAKDDHNNALRQYARINLPGLIERYRVVYYETDSFDNFEDQFWTGIEQNPSLVIVGAHGSQESAALGHESFMRRMVAGTDRLLSLDNIPILTPAASLMAGVHMLLLSCSLASGGENAVNVANTFSYTFPETTIQAMMVPGNADRHAYDEDGRLVDANLTVPSYIINHSERRYERVDSKIRWTI